jgi:DNA invertase Pin-like site-specific DNA recombinase
VAGSTRKEHDERIRATLTAARRNGVKFNPKKIQKCSSEVKLFGELITKDGLKPHPSKVAAVRNMTSPQNKKELEIQLGMFTYLAQYSPHLSEKTAILRELVKKDTQLELLSGTRRCIYRNEVYHNASSRSSSEVLRYW